MSHRPRADPPNPAARCTIASRKHPQPLCPPAHTLRPCPNLPLADALPLSADAPDGRLRIGGCDLRDLADQFGTPLYVYDEHTIRTICRQYLAEFEQRLPGARVLYAAKAWLSPALVRILVEEGLGIDVVSDGELHVARAGGMPPERIGMHGNAKSRRELERALDAGIGRIIIDNDDELDLIDQLTRDPRPNPARDAPHHPPASTPAPTKRPPPASATPNSASPSPPAKPPAPSTAPSKPPTSTSPASTSTSAPPSTTPGPTKKASP